MSKPSLPKALSPGEEGFAMYCRVYGLTPEREYRFHPSRRWKFDFAFPALKIAVEIEGGAWSNGRHNRGSGFRADLEKYNTALLLGWSVFRFTTEMVQSGHAIDTILPLLGNAAVEACSRHSDSHGQ